MTQHSPPNKNTYGRDATTEDLCSPYPSIFLRKYQMPQIKILRFRIFHSKRIWSLSGSALEPENGSFGQHSSVPHDYVFRIPPPAPYQHFHMVVFSNLSRSFLAFVLFGAPFVCIYIITLRAHNNQDRFSVICHFSLRKGSIDPYCSFNLPPKLNGWKNPFPSIPRLLSSFGLQKETSLFRILFTLLFAYLFLPNIFVAFCFLLSFLFKSV